MEIKIQLFGKVYSLCFGYKTHWFGQIDFFTITEEEWYKMKVTWARSIFRTADIRKKLKLFLPGL